MDILNTLRARLPDCSPTEKRIAACILEAPEQIINETITHLARRCESSVGSIVNFSSAVGCAGFSDLKVQIAHALGKQNRISFEDVHKTDAPKEAMRKLLENAARSFRSTYDALGDELTQAASALMQARRIEIYCVGSSVPLGQALYYDLMRLGLPVSLLTDPVMACLSASQLSEGAVAFAISHSGRTADTLMAAQTARSHGAKLIALTSFSASPLAELSDVTLLAVSNEALEEREAVVAHLTQSLLITSLCTYIAAQRGAQSMKLLDTEIEMLEHHRKTR